MLNKMNVMRFFSGILFAGFFIAACQSETSENDIAASENEVWMASQERYIEYVDSVAILGEGLLNFAKQPVENPYYDTVYNSSSLVISEGNNDSLEVTTFPDFKAGAILFSKEGTTFIRIPDFNDTLVYTRRSEDSLVLSKKRGKTYSETYFHPVTPTEGSLEASSLVGTHWHLDNQNINFISFLSSDSCLIRIETNEISAVGRGPWNIQRINGRDFISFYSLSSSLPVSVFSVHQIESADPNTMVSHFFQTENFRSDLKNEKYKVQWTLENEENNAGLSGLAGEWSTTENPLRSDSKPDSISNTTFTIIFSTDGTFQQIFTGSLNTGAEAGVIHETSGAWTADSHGHYLELMYENGVTKFASIDHITSDSLTISINLAGLFKNDPTETRQRLHFKRQ